MGVLSRLKDTLAHPVTAVLGVIGALAGVGFDPASAIALALWTNAGTLFTATGVVASDFAPTMPSLPTGAVETLSLVFGAMYVAKLLLKVLDKYV